MNRYDIQGVAFDVANGKTVVILTPRARHAAVLDLVIAFLDEIGAAADRVYLAAGAKEIRMQGGGRLLLRSGAIAIRGLTADVVFDEIDTPDAEIWPAIAERDGEIFR